LKWHIGVTVSKGQSVLKTTAILWLYSLEALNLMVLQILPGDDGFFVDFDLNQIFIPREQQEDLFELNLNRWKNRIFAAESNGTLNNSPSPNNKIQGLVVLLYGRGGFGKSTLLRRYHEKVLQQNLNPLLSKVFISNIVDWEFAAEGERGFFNLPESQEVDANGYYKLLCKQLAIALKKHPKDFKEYQSSVKDIEKTQKQASGVLENLQKEDSYNWLRGLTVETITAVIRYYVPPSKVLLDNPTVKLAANEVAKITQEQALQVRTRLHNKLGNKLDDYLDPALRLGLALGYDLCEFSKNFPSLIFFDTYEEIDEGDRLLRIIMGAAGLRVGWVIAGRDNLWSGLEQRKRKITMEYNYKDIVLSDRGLPINFNSDEVGAFTTGDIMNYFAQLCKKVHYKRSLPKISEKEAALIYDVTQGVPLERRSSNTILGY